MFETRATRHAGSLSAAQRSSRFPQPLPRPAAQLTAEPGALRHLGPRGISDHRPQLDTALATAWDQLGADARRLQPGEDTRDEGVVDAAHELGRPARQRVERAVAQPEAGR